MAPMHRLRAAGMPAIYQPHRLGGDFPLRAVAYTLGDAPIAHLHQHDALELGICHRGAGTYLVEDKRFRFAAGSALVVGPRELHYSRSDPGTTSGWTYVFVDPLRLLADCGADAAALARDDLGGPGFPNVLDPALHPGPVALIARIAAEAIGRHPQRNALLRGLVLALLADLRRLPGAVARERGDLAALGPALDLIARHPAAPPLPRLAAACSMAPSTFRRAFAAAFGCAPRDWLLRRRIQRAALALADAGTSVADAARAAGFASSSAFHRHFRRIMGTTPRRWREDRR